MFHTVCTHVHCTCSYDKDAFWLTLDRHLAEGPVRSFLLTIPPMLAKRSKPMVVCTCNNPNRRGCSGTMQGIVMGAAQMLTQGFNNCTNLQDRDSASAKRHGLPNRLQTSSYGARKVPSTISNRKCIINIVKQDCLKKRPNKTSSYLVPNLEF